MRYLLLICDDPSADPYDPATDDIEEWVTALDNSGAYVVGDRLRPVVEARTVRVRSGETTVSEAPFSSGPVSLAGFDVIEAPDRDAALDVASRHPMARFGCIEVRELWPFSV